MAAITRVTSIRATCRVCGWEDQKVKLVQWNRQTMYLCDSCLTRLQARVERINQEARRETTNAKR